MYPEFERKPFGSNNGISGGEYKFKNGANFIAFFSGAVQF